MTCDKNDGAFAGASVEDASGDDLLGDGRLSAVWNRGQEVRMRKEAKEGTSGCWKMDACD